MNSIWNGCVGAWCPSRGATGWIIRDNSLYRVNAELDAAVDPGTALVADSGGIAFLCDGTNDFASAAVNTFMQGLTAGSISVWNKMTPGASNHCVTGFAIADFSRFNILWYQGATIYAQVENGGYNFPNYSYTSSEWSHFLMTYDAGDAVRLYVNGLEVSLSFGGGSFPSSLASSLGVFAIGKQPSNSLYQNGMSDDVRLWNRCLTPSEARFLSSRRGAGFDRLSLLKVKRQTTSTNYMRRKLLLCSS